MGIYDNAFIRGQARDPLRMTPEDHLRLERAPKLPPEKQWWNLPAKIAAGHRIAEEERERSVQLARQAGLANAHNNEFDAMRHARWSNRMSTEIGPVFSALAGAEHELEGSWRGQSIGEAMMDLRNNAEGRRAAAQRRAINAGKLQSRPDAPRASGYY